MRTLRALGRAFAGGVFWVLAIIVIVGSCAVAGVSFVAIVAMLTGALT